MAFKGFFKAIKKEVTNEIGRQIDKAVNKRGGGGGDEDQIQSVNMSAVEGVLGECCRNSIIIFLSDSFIHVYHWIIS